MADVLIVEDDFSTRTNLMQLLEKSGYSVSSAETGEQALELFQNDTPDLILSDITMPGIDGYELFRRVNADDNDDHIPFIFLTGRTETSDFREGMQTGADDYITKPFKAKDLLKSIETRLKKKAKLDKKIQKFKSRVTHNISHEFRTPLVPIVGYSQMIEENYWRLGPDEVLEMTKKIQSSGSWMLKLVEKFLLLIELEEETNTTEENYASLKEVIYNCTSRIGNSTGRADDIMINAGSAVVRIPSLQLERIITELLENACRFSNSGSPVEITSRSEGDFHYLTITDYGKGMTADQMKSLSSFLQFSREGMHQAGLGLGLAIVKKIAEKNDVSLTIESVPGQFTKVGLKLPLWSI